LTERQASAGENYPHPIIHPFHHPGGEFTFPENQVLPRTEAAGWPSEAKPTLFLFPGQKKFDLATPRAFAEKSGRPNPGVVTDQNVARL
jgi:hypothetical protein